MKMYQYVNNHWNDAEVAELSGVDRLVYRSNKLGSYQRITNTGGGNTSSKILETDPLTGEQVEVLWVKGSGGDLRTSLRENFSSLYQDKLIGLQKSYAVRSDKGLKSQAEDDMVAAYNHMTFNLNPHATSIDTSVGSGGLLGIVSICGEFKKPFVYYSLLARWTSAVSKTGARAWIELVMILSSKSPRARIESLPAVTVSSIRTGGSQSCGGCH